MVANNVLARVAGPGARLLAPYNGLQVEWSESWRPSFDEALRSLPEMESCPHELFRLLIQNPSPARKRVALVSDRGTPVAIAGLRQRSRYSWEPVTQWIVPGALFPVQPGFLVAALEALQLELWVAWWRMHSPPPPSRLIRSMESTPTYRMHRADDFEQYWRQIGYFKTVRRMRNRCRAFKAAVNLADAAEWTIKHWEARWRKDGATADPSLPDRIAAARYLERQGRHFTITLLDGDAPIGGATMTVQQRDLVAGVLFSDLRYRPYGVGDRLIDLSFSLWAERGYETFDIGGGHEYKRHWARQEGERCLFSVCPEPLFRLKQLARLARRLWRRNAAGAAVAPRAGNSP